MMFQGAKRSSLRQNITVMVGLSLLALSSVLIAFAEIRNAARIDQQRVASRAVQADLVRTMLALEHERLSTLAQIIATDRQVDAAFNGNVTDLEKVLDVAVRGSPVALAVIAASGDILATSVKRSIAIDAVALSTPQVEMAKSQLLVGADTLPLLLHHAPIRRGNRVVGTVLAVLPLVEAVDKFFPDIAGLAIRSADGIIKPVFGDRFDTTLVPEKAKIAILTGESGRRFEAVFFALEFGESSHAGDLVLIRDVTNALLREEFLFRLTVVAILVVILISLGLLTRALRIGLRPLGAAVHLLGEISRGNTKIRFKHTGNQSSVALKQSALQENDAEKFSPKKYFSRDEIGVLLSVVDDLRVSIEAQNALIAVNEQLDNARRIQQSLLPQSFEVDPGFDIFGCMRPALEVAGDFFDLFKLDDGQIAIVIADVSGKGIAPALFAAQANILLRTHLHQCREPAEAVRLTNQTLCERNPEGMFLTCILAMITPETGEVSFVNAGHCPPMILRKDNKVEQVITEPDPILGIVPDFFWTQHSLELTFGECFLLHSDGFDEAQSSGGDMLGADEAIKMFAKSSQSQKVSSQRIAQNLLEEIDTFAAGVPQADDITLIIVRELINPDSARG